MSWRPRAAALASLFLLVPVPASAQQREATHPSAGEDDTLSHCDPAFIEHVYKAAKPSIVRLTRPDGGLGTGFVFFTKKYVATALHVVDLGRGVRVEFPGGVTTTAEVVAWDTDHDVALLELADAADGEPIAPRWHVEVGSPVLAIGNPYGDLPRFSRELEGLLNFSVSQGIVSARSDAFIQTDAALSPGNSGGPIMSCDGHVVAIADRLLEQRIGFGVPIVHVSHLLAQLDAPGRKRFRGRWTGKDTALGVVWHRDAVDYFGPYLGGSLVAYDRFSITTRLGVLFGAQEPTPDPIVDRSMHRFFAELVLGYRAILFPYAFPTYLTLGAGMLATIDRGEETRLAGVVGDGGKVNLQATTTNVRGGGIMPLGNVVLQLGGLEASYGFALDVVHPGFSTHRVLLGLSL
ncbi:MAG: HtrA protease/chaperone protein [Labilithrix sp.]|nr:HtrA protease/chaperone protein [Labilithrix sp.]